MPPPKLEIEEGTPVTVQLFSVYGFARNLGVRVSDTLVAINGVPFDGGPKELFLRFAGQKRRKNAFTLLRDGREFTILSDSWRFGEWYKVPAPEQKERTRLYPDVMKNYEVYADRHGRYDLNPIQANAIALWAMPIYLLQMRLWMPLAAVFAGVVLSIPVGIWMSTVVYLLASVYVWKSGVLLIRGDRIAHGMRHAVTVAASSEEMAHRAAKAFDPKLTYKFKGTQSLPEPAMEEEPQTQPTT